MNSMAISLRDIGSIFNEDFQLDKFEEDFEHVNIEFSLGECSSSTISQEEPDFSLNSRDEISISYLEETGFSAEFHPKKNKRWSDFVDSINENKAEENANVIVNIKKEVIENRISIYSISYLHEYFQNKSYSDIIGKLDDLIFRYDKLIFEVQGSDFKSFYTNRFAWVSIKEEVSINPQYDYSDIIKKQQDICSSNLHTERLIPDDLIPIPEKEQSEILSSFQLLAQLLLLCYISDYSKVTNDEIRIKINGYKTICKKFKSDKLSNINFNVESLEIYSQIYRWMYSGGNIYDKAVIVRQIFSLNVDSELRLSSTTYESILSNYQIFAKKNVEQYISLRTNVSVQLRSYQKEIINIVSQFEDDIKKMFFGFMTFVFTTVVIRVISKTSSSDVVLPNTIAVMLIVYCIASIIYYFYERWIMNKRIDLLDEKYNETRKFYSGILSEKELKELFVDKNDENGKYRAFLDERNVHFTWLWVVLNFIVIVFLLILIFCINK